MRTKPRLSSRFCLLFCGAKQTKTSPVRRLSTSYSIFLVLEPQNLVSFNGAGRGGGVFFFVAGVSKSGIIPAMLSHVYLTN